VARARFDERQDQQFGTAFFPFELRRCEVHIWG
jgi:hypothetical protein